MKDRMASPTGENIALISRVFEEFRKDACLPGDDRISESFIKAGLTLLEAVRDADARPVAMTCDEWLLTRNIAAISLVREVWAAALATRNAAPSDALKHDAWKEPFAERHEFDIYPDHFMTGLRNEFAAGWHAAIKAGTSVDKP